MAWLEAGAIAAPLAEHLPACPTLTKLDLSAWIFTSAHLRTLAAGLPLLQELRCRGARFEDLSGLSLCKSLVELRLDDCLGVLAAHLLDLQSVASLRNLLLCRTLSVEETRKAREFLILPSLQFPQLIEAYLQ
jgi:hypothetical protein